jgi:hypothetical protein
MQALHRLGTGLAFALAFPLAPVAGLAVTSATIAFDFVTDPGDVADGPDYQIAGSGLVDDDGTSCDLVAAVIVDATGTPTDADSFCLSTVSGLGASDGDYGSMEGAYVPVAGPATYAVFDLTAADIAALTGLSDNQAAYVNYVLANARFLVEGYVDVQGLPSGTPFSLKRSDFQCYQAKDLKLPKFAPMEDLAVEDGFGSSAIDVSKPFLVCRPAGVAGRAIAEPGVSLCCYKTKGAKLSPPEALQTEDAFGTLLLEAKSPKVFCTSCTAGPPPTE